MHAGVYVRMYEMNEEIHKNAQTPTATHACRLPPLTRACTHNICVRFLRNFSQTVYLSRTRSFFLILNLILFLFLALAHSFARLLFLAHTQIPTSISFSQTINLTRMRSPFLFFFLFPFLFLFLALALARSLARSLASSLFVVHTHKPTSISFSPHPPLF